MADKSRGASDINQAMNNSTMEAVLNKDADTVNYELLLLNVKKAEAFQIASAANVGRAKQRWEESLYKQREKAILDSNETETVKAQKLTELKKNSLLSIADLAHKIEMNLYKYADKNTKLQLLSEKRKTLESAKYERKLRLAEDLAAARTDEERRQKEKAAMSDLMNANNKQIELGKRQRGLAAEALKESRAKNQLDRNEMQRHTDAIREAYQMERDGHIENLRLMEGEEERLKEQLALTEDANKREEIRGQLDNLSSAQDKEKAALKQTDKDGFKGELVANAMEKGFAALDDRLNKIAEKVTKAVDEAIQIVGQYKSHIDARLQGTQSSYDSVANTLKSTLALSGMVKQKEVLEKISKAVDEGIAYNVEQRAFLATMTDKIVATFDAFDANLMRIIRLQQADTTAARMGMEANLLQFFNSTFSDSSYLTDGYDSVSQALVDANAQMTRDMSIAFEYNVQKWMGSLASLGFGTDTIQTIATGINYLGSGNVQALANDTQLQSLLAMSASRAGLSYSDLLVQGIDDSSVNDLLKAMVEYLAEIANSDNAVVKAAYGDVFNFSQADLRAIKNLSSSDISNIANQSMTYGKAMNEIQNQLNQVRNRLSMSEMIDNVFDNFMYTTAESMANNPVTALMWKTISTIEEATGGIELPFVNLMGYGLDLNMSVESLLKTGMFGLSALGNVGKMVSSLSSGGGMSLDAWGGTEYTKRGGNFSSTIGGVQSSISGSNAVTSASSSDTKKQAISETEEDQESQRKASKEAMKDEITIETLYNEMFEKKTAIYTIDVPAVEKLSEAVAGISDTNSKLTEIHSVMINEEEPMLVRVANLDTISEYIPSAPEEITIKKISDPAANTLANKISDGIVGKTDDSSQESYTISDLVNLLLNGVIRVSDDSARDQLCEINKNLL